MKKVLFIIAPENFRDEELLHTKEVLDSKGVETAIASTKQGECRGLFGAKVESTLTLDKVDVDDFDAFVFVGGRGTSIIRSTNEAMDIIRSAYTKGKLVCAICWAPTILGKAGILEGKKSTVWVGDDPEYNMKTNEVLEKFGATYVNEGVVKDGSIITADGPKSAKLFGEKIAESLG